MIFIFGAEMIIIFGFREGEIPFISIGNQRLLSLFTSDQFHINKLVVSSICTYRQYFKLCNISLQLIFVSLTNLMQ